MSEDYEVVARVVAAVADVWGEPAERLHRVAGEVEELEQRLRDQGVRRSNELQAIALAVAETELLVRDDPLALSPTTVEELQARATRLRASLEEILRRRAARLADLEAVEESIAAGRAAVAAGREELDRVARKILVLDETRAALERVALEYDRLAGEAGLARQPGASGSCSALAVQAEGLMEEVTRLAGTADSGLRARDELRGVLTAYQAKAQALGLAEDVELGELYAATREELYSAPCDLGRAEQRVLEYQRAIRAGIRGKVVTACTRPDCGGSIDAGYCNVCGYPPSRVVPAPVSRDVPAAPHHEAGGPLHGVGRTRRHATRTMSRKTATAAAGLAPRLAASGRIAVDPGSPASVPPPAVSVPTSSRGTSTVRRFAMSSGTNGRPSGATGPGGSRGNLGAGLVEVPSVAHRDPHAAVLANPEVPERKRFCARCDHPVGRARGARPARTEGFCPHCGGVYSFTPKLTPPATSWGGSTGGKPEVHVAHGGRRWISRLLGPRNVEGLVDRILKRLARVPRTSRP